MTDLSGESKFKIMNKPIYTTKDSADILKLIMSVFVVATHTSFMAPYLTPVLRLAVPVFFVLSGYFFFSKVNSFNEYEEQKAYLKKSVKHNLQLYYSWFIVLLPLTVYVRGYYKKGLIEALLELIHDFIFASTFQASWYIMALIICFILAFYLKDKCSNLALLIIGIALYIPALISSNYHFLISQSESAMRAYSVFTNIFALPCNNFFAGFIYVILGKILSEDKENHKKTVDAAAGLILCALLIGEYLLLYFGKVQIKNTDCFIMLPATAFYICKWTLSLNLSCKHSKTMRKLSTISYCAHMPVFMCLGKILTLLDIGDKLNIIVFALTLVLTWALGLVILKLEKHKVFGFLKYFH